MPITLVLHTTQGGTAAGAQSTLENNNDRSHDILAVAENGWVIPLLPHNEFARSLVHIPGQEETNNRGGVIQVEMVGFANRATAEYYGYTRSEFIIPEWGDKELGYLADYIISVHQNDGLKIIFPKPFLPYAESYGSNNGVRLSLDEWLVVEGIIGHEHVPENEHGDPGEINVKRLQQIIASKLFREEDMFLITPATGIQDGVFAYNGTHIRWVNSGIELALLRRKGVQEWTDVSDAEMRAIIGGVGKVGIAPTSGGYAGTW